MANENKPLVEVKPGDPITAGRWNDMQRALRQEHIQHTHTGVWKDGLFDGAPITEAGLATGAVTTTRLADNAVTGAKVDPSSDVRVRKLTVSGQDLAADASALAVTGPLNVQGPATVGSLKVSGPSEHASLTVTGPATLGSLKVSGTSEHMGLKVDGQTTLGGLKVGGASEHASLTVGGTLKVGGLGELAGLVVGANATTNTLKCLGAAEIKQLTVANSLLLMGKTAVVAEGGLPRIVWGNISAEAMIYAGNGFTVTHKPDGEGFLITFDTPFASWPCVVTQQMGDGDTRDNTLVKVFEKGRMYVYTGDSLGKKVHRPFSFLAIGLG